MFGYFKIFDSQGVSTQVEIINFFINFYLYIIIHQVKMSQCRSDIHTDMNNYVLSNLRWMFHLRSKLNKFEHVGGGGFPVERVQVEQVWTCPGAGSLYGERSRVPCTGNLCEQTEWQIHDWKPYIPQLRWRATKYSRKIIWNGLNYDEN